MKPLPSQICKQRTKTLTDFFYSYEPYRDRVGVRYSILVTDLSHDKYHYVGHNDYYEQILLPKNEQLMGKVVQVEIIGSTKFSMISRVVDGSVQSPTDIEPLKLGQISGAAVTTSYESSLGETSNYFIFKWSFVLCLLALLFRLVKVFLPF